MLLKKIDDCFFYGKTKVSTINYYSFDELADILSVPPAKKNKLFKWIRHFALEDTYTGTEHIYKEAQDNHFNLPIAPLSFSEKKIFIPYKNRTKTEFLTDKKGVLAFIANRQKELVELGCSENKIKAILFNLEYYPMPTEGLMEIWSLCKKLVRNSYVAKALADYIKTNLITGTYHRQQANDKMQIRDMFAYVQGERKVGSFYFKTEALKAFQENFKYFLRDFIARAEEQNEFEDFRSFVRQFRHIPNLEKSLKDYIIANCLSDKITEQDEAGNVVLKNMFEISNRSTGVIIKVRKKGKLDFVRRHQEALAQMGVDTQFILEKEAFPVWNRKDYVTLGILSGRFGSMAITAELLQKLVQKHNLTQVIVPLKGVINQTAPLVEELYCLNQKTLFIREENIPHFVSLLKEEFLNQGVHLDKINRLIGVDEIADKTDEMMSFREFSRFLKLPIRAVFSLTRDIKNNYLEDTYLSMDENGRQKEEKIFQYVKSGTAYTYVFKSKEAILAFVKKHQDFLISHKVNPLLITSLTEGIEIHPLDSRRHLKLEDLNQQLHLGRRSNIKTSFLKQIANTVYPTLDENGNTSIQKMVELAEDSVGKIIPVLRKDSLKYFALKYQKQLNINPLEVDALWGKIKVKEHTKDLISLSYLFWIMGTSCSPKLTQLAETKWINETYTTRDEKGNQQEEPLFVYSRPPNAPLILCFDLKGIDVLVNRHSAELKESGLYVDAFLRAQKSSGLTLEGYTHKRYQEVFLLRLNQYQRAKAKRAQEIKSVNQRG